MQVQETGWARLFYGTKDGRSDITALLSCSRFIRDEATPIIYRENTFEFNEFEILQTFLMRLPRHLSSHLRRINVTNSHFHELYVHSTFEYLASRTQLDNLTFHGCCTGTHDLESFFQMTAPWLKSITSSKQDLIVALQTITWTTVDSNWIPPFGSLCNYCLFSSNDHFHASMKKHIEDKLAKSATLRGSGPKRSTLRRRVN